MKTKNLISLDELIDFRKNPVKESLWLPEFRESWRQLQPKLEAYKKLRDELENETKPFRELCGSCLRWIGLGGKKGLCFECRQAKIDAYRRRYYQKKRQKLIENGKIAVPAGGTTTG